jgi:hypothetical protein
MRRLFAMAAGAASPDPAAYRERLQEILARREFRAVPRDGSLPDVDLTPEWPGFIVWLAEHFGAVWDRFL